MKRASTVTLDVRPQLARGEEPCSKIMAVVAGLRKGERLKLIAPFEPLPLYSVLEMQGYTHESKPVANGDWEVVFSRPD